MYKFNYNVKIYGEFYIQRGPEKSMHASIKEKAV